MSWRDPARWVTGRTKGSFLHAQYRRLAARRGKQQATVAVGHTTRHDRVYAVLDNLRTHRALDVLLWALAHPRWEFVFQPTYAAYLNLIEPWWKVLRSLALQGRCFANWTEVCQAVEAATRYWNAHRHPFLWGRRKRRRPARTSGIACLPVAA